MTSEATNHLAWIGHAACSLATGCPEYITRFAWGTLTQEQRDLANSEAENALSLWKSHNHSQDSESLPVTKSTRELGYKAKIQAWIQKWESRGYPEGIPDEAPFNLEEKLRVPSYRMVCLAIMKNDVTLETLGFARKPCDAYIAIKREEIALRERLRSNE